MRITDYIFLTFLSISTVVAVILGFNRVGTPWTERKMKMDRQRESDFRVISTHVQRYSDKNGELPRDLDQLNIPSSVGSKDCLVDPVSGEVYEYKVISGLKYQLCTEFYIDTRESINKSIGKGEDFGPVEVFGGLPTLPLSYSEHSSGYDCIEFEISKPSKSESEPRVLKSELYESFENWTDASLPRGWVVESGAVSRSTDSYDRNYAAEFEAEKGESIIVSEDLKVGANRNYEVSFWYETESICGDCMFVGFEIFDENGSRIASGVDNCGTYSPFHFSWYRYLEGHTQGYEKYTATCTLPFNTATFKMKVGVWSASNNAWTIDSIKLAPAKSAIYPSANKTARDCPVELKDGLCVLPNCSYTYPNDIYIKGKVITGDAYRGVGIPAGTFHDECGPDGKQVIEVECSGSLEGTYTMSRATYSCPKGCVSGACIE